MIDSLRLLPMNLMILLVAGVVSAAEIGGNVHASGGAVLSGVEVRILDTSGSFFDLTTTDGSGHYSFNDLDPGNYFLWTRNRMGYIDELYSDIPCVGGCDYFSGTPVTAGDGVDGIDFELARGGAISGSITADDGGDPLPGIEVSVYDSEGRQVEHVETSATGAWETETGLPDGEYFLTTGNEDGYFDEIWDDQPCNGACDPTTGDAVTVTAPDMTGDIDFSLSRGGRISGTVTSSGDGAPIENVRIDFFDAEGNLITSARPDGTGSYISDAALAPGSYHAVTDNWWGHVDELYDDVVCFSGCALEDGTPITVGSGNTGNIDFILDPGGWITGTVTDQQTGDPLENLGIEVFDSEGHRAGTVFPDSSGVYWVSGLPSGHYYLEASPWDDHLSQLFDGITCIDQCDPSGGDPISVTQPDITSGIDFQLVSGGVIRGSVDTYSGNPPEGGDVLILDEEGFPVVVVSLDIHGRFNSGAIPAGRYYLLIDAFDDDLVDEIYDNIPCVDFCDPEVVGTPIDLGTGETLEITARLSRGGTLIAHVGSIEGSPLAECDIEVFDGEGNLLTVGFTDETGTAVLKGFPGDLYFARTRNHGNYVDQLYEEIECVLDCDVTIGTAVAVTPGATSSDIYFSLDSAVLFADDFETGSTGVWTHAVGEN